jgi:hypothetical protein
LTKFWLLSQETLTKTLLHGSSPKTELELPVKKKTALALIKIILIALTIVSVQPINASSQTITVSYDYPSIAAAIGNATDGDTPQAIDENTRYSLMAPFGIDSGDVPLPEWANIVFTLSPSQEPTSTPEFKQQISIPTVWIIAIASLVAVVLIELIIYFFLQAKRSKSKEKQ